MNFPDRFPVLHTERLLLRETALQDVEGVFAMESDPVAMRYWNTPPMNDLEQARALLESAEAGDFRLTEDDEDGSRSRPS